MSLAVLLMFLRLYVCVGGMSVCDGAEFTVYVCLHPLLGAGPVRRHAWAQCVCAGGESLVSHVFAHEMHVCAQTSVCRVSGVCSMPETCVFASNWVVWGTCVFVLGVWGAMCVKDISWSLP